MIDVLGTHITILGVMIGGLISTIGALSVSAIPHSETSTCARGRESSCALLHGYSRWRVLLAVSGARELGTQPRYRRRRCIRSPGGNHSTRDNQPTNV